jgi:hypothetical protein
MDNLSVRQSADCSAVRARGNEDHLQPRGRFVVEHFRKGVKIGQYEFSNNVTNEGKNQLLNVQFNAATAITAWYLGLIDGSGTPTLAVGDTYAQIGGTNGWNESTIYTASTRQAWGNGAAASQSVTNSTSVVFNMNASGSVYGLFVVGGGSAAATKNDHSGGGTLWADAAFSSGTQTVTNGDQLKVTYTISC